MEQSKMKIIEDIVKTLEEKKVIGFLINEIIYNLKHMNIYKIQNILNNLDLFIEKILQLQSNYIKSLKV